MELSTDKTKRELINLLTNYAWSYQYSVFFDVSHMDNDQAKAKAVNWLDDFDDIKLRDYLRKTSNTAILFVIRTALIKNRLDNKRFKQVYLTMYCNSQLNLEGYLNSKIEGNLNVMKREINAVKMATTVNAIKNQKLHDLAFLGSKKRYSLINKKLLLKL